MNEPALNVFNEHLLLLTLRAEGSAVHGADDQPTDPVTTSLSREFGRLGFWSSLILAVVLFIVVSFVIRSPWLA